MAACKVMEIDVHDHVIVGFGRVKIAFSMRSAGMLTDQDSRISGIGKRQDELPRGDYRSAMFGSSREKTGRCGKPRYSENAFRAEASFIQSRPPKATRAR